MNEYDIHSFVKNYLKSQKWRNVCSEYDETMTRSLFFVIQASCTLKSMDRRLSEYVKKVVMEHGVTTTLKMKLLLQTSKETDNHR